MELSAQRILISSSVNSNPDCDNCSIAVLTKVPTFNFESGSEGIESELMWSDVLSASTLLVSLGVKKALNQSIKNCLCDSNHSFVIKTC